MQMKEKVNFCIMVNAEQGQIYGRLKKLCKYISYENRYRGLDLFRLEEKKLPEDQATYQCVSKKKTGLSLWCAAKAQEFMFVN